MRSCFLTAAMVLGAACTDSLPCSNCPAMEGTYAFTWQAPTTNVTGCSRLTTPRPSMLTFNRVGSSLTSSLDGQELRGTLFDTYDFTLSGGVDIASNLRGRLVTGSDAGAIRLTGTLRTSLGVADAGLGHRCDYEEKFVADKL